VSTRRETKARTVIRDTVSSDLWIELLFAGESHAVGQAHCRRNVDRLTAILKELRALDTTASKRALRAERGRGHIEVVSVTDCELFLWVQSLPSHLSVRSGVGGDRCMFAGDRLHLSAVRGGSLCVDKRYTPPV